MGISQVFQANRLSVKTNPGEDFKFGEQAPKQKISENERRAVILKGLNQVSVSFFKHQ